MEKLSAGQNLTTETYYLEIPFMVNIIGLMKSGTQANKIFMLERVTESYH